MTWKLTKQAENLLRVAQRAMERALLGITLRDRKRSIWIKEKTEVKDIIIFSVIGDKRICSVEGKWAWHSMGSCVGVGWMG